MTREAVAEMMEAALNGDGDAVAAIVGALDEQTRKEVGQACNIVSLHCDLEAWEEE